MMKKIPLGQKLLPLLLFLLLFPGLVWSAEAAEPAKITVFYTSDTHGSVFSDDRVIGLDLVAALKKAEPDALLLDAGDFLNGEVPASFSQGRDIMRLMRLAGYDAATVGNHEFDHGLERLLEYRVQALSPPALPLLSANIFRLGERLILFEPAVIFERQGARIGVFGLSVPEERTRQGLFYARPRDSAEVMVKRLKAAGCGIVIALTHLGNDDGYPESSLTLDGLDGLDLVIDGHSHKKRDLRLPLGLPLFSPGSGARDVGRLVISYDAEAKGVAALSNALLDKTGLEREYPGLRPDPAVRAALLSLDEKIEAALATPAGTLPEALEAEGQRVRIAPTKLGIFCAEAMRRAYASDVALLNGGALRGGLPQGTVSWRDLHGLLPYGAGIAEFSLSGLELMEVLEHSLSGLPQPWGGYLQVAGISLQVDEARPGGSRLLGATLADGSPLRPERSYSVTVNDYMAGGGNGYRWFAEKVPLRSGADMREAVAAMLPRP